MTRKIIIAAIILLALLTTFFCSMIVKELKQSQKEKDEFQSLSSIVKESTEVITKEQTLQQELSAENTVQEPVAVHKRNLQPLFDENPDCIGWVSIPDTQVDYPVMHTPQEPQKYLRKAFNGEYSISGVPFLQDSSTLDSDNLVLYGHSMNNGTMFTDIIKYKSKDYYEAHSYIEFETAEGLQIFDVFAVVQLKETDVWYFFDSFNDEEQYQQLVTDLMSKSLYETQTAPKYGRQMLTLSTCHGSNADDRIIVVGIEREQISQK